MRVLEEKVRKITCDSEQPIRELVNPTEKPAEQPTSDPDQSLDTTAEQSTPDHDYSLDITAGQINEEPQAQGIKSNQSLLCAEYNKCRPYSEMLTYRL